MCQQIPLNINFLNEYIISRLKIWNNIFHSFLKLNILSLPIIIVYGTIRECGLELRSSHKCFFSLQIILMWDSVSVQCLTMYSALYFHSSFIATHVINLIFHKSHFLKHFDIKFWILFFNQNICVLHLNHFIDCPHDVF